MKTMPNRETQITTQTYSISWRACFVAALLVATLGVLADAQPITFNEPTPTTEDRFGWAVALDGNNVLIGANAHAENPEDRFGKAHLFDAVTGNLLQTFYDPTPTGYDRFGRSVALDGNHVLIGASHADTAGQAHLFDLSGNLLQTFDDPTPTTGDQFGWNVDLDGNNVLISARYDDTLGHEVGQAHLFDGNPLSPTFGNLLQTFDDPTPTTEDNFGFSATLDGNNVLIAAWHDDTLGTDVGQAHLFDLNGNLLQTFDDPTPTTADGFGFRATLDGNNVLISANRDDTNGTDVGQAHLFDLSGNLLQTFDDPTPTTEDRFGSSATLDGNNVLISASRDDTNGADVGQAHLFDFSGNLLRTFDDPTPTTEDRFGSSVALDGNNVLIGAQRDDTLGTNVGQAHLFSITPGDLNLDGFVDGVDAEIMFGNWGPTTLGYLDGNLNGDAFIDAADFGTLVANWTGDVGPAAASIPEPSSLLLVSFAGCVLLRRRRRV